MKKNKFIALAATALLVTSCSKTKVETTNPESAPTEIADNGNAAEEKPVNTMTPVSEKISGDLGEYFTVVKKDYKISDDYFPEMIIELKRTDKEFPFKVDADTQVHTFDQYNKINYKSYIEAGFGINYKDKDGNIVSKKNANASSPASSEEDLKTLLRLKPGETGTMEIKMHDKEHQKANQFELTSALNNKLAAQVDSVKTTSADRYVVVDDNDNDNDFDYDYDYDMDDSYVSTTTSSSSSSSNNIDALLTQYENEMNDYLRAIKNADYNNISPTLKKVTDTYSQIIKQGLNMTQAQRERLANIYARMSKNF